MLMFVPSYASEALDLVETICNSNAIIAFLLSLTGSPISQLNLQYLY